MAVDRMENRMFGPRALLFLPPPAGCPILKGSFSQR